uniref:Uncharacterized protein n=1 Tax=Aegilops tauschii subsp. strangulata TaxID=200361 RepID=A0A453K013_AEGTS
MVSYNKTINPLTACSVEMDLKGIERELIPYKPKSLQILSNPPMGLTEQSLKDVSDRHESSFSWTDKVVDGFCNTICDDLTDKFNAHT